MEVSPLSKKIKRIKRNIIKSNKNANQIFDLHKYLKLTNDDPGVFSSLQALKQIFLHYLKEKKLIFASSVSESGLEPDSAERKFNEWVTQQFARFTKQLLVLLDHKEPGIQIPSLTALITFLPYHDVESKYCDSIMAKLIALKNLNEHLETKLKDVVSPTLVSRFLIISLTRTLKKKESFSNKELNMAWNLLLKLQPANTKEFTNCVFAFLSYNFNKALLKDVLSHLDRLILPRIENPILLMDFLLSAFKRGKFLSILALQGIFVLITRHNLDFPDYYSKLYSLLTIPLFVLKNEQINSFFILLDQSLSTIMMPEYMAAAFLKRLARIALHSPPDSCLLILGLVGNILIRHPGTLILLHDRTGRKGTFNESKVCEKDPFIFEEPNPLKSNAISSSLWEIRSLRAHYFPHVSRFATILENTAQIKEKYQIQKLLKFNNDLLFNSEFSQIKDWEKIPMEIFDQFDQETNSKNEKLMNQQEKEWIEF
ncbi:nucleolar complex protein 4 [Anaeramoeba flamelloides]|uniref:Nucleolar complex protein 4 n=1 Tax=Anaeramoeba flamelloides TaxID=1746091 RepID=A0AAV7ZNJ4_9EUKA|nr:nucleolar complex protein 4 [Anaeramoeba flamelloides]